MLEFSLSADYTSKAVHHNYRNIQFQQRNTITTSVLRLLFQDNLGKLAPER